MLKKIGWTLGTLFFCGAAYGQVSLPCYAKLATNQPYKPDGRAQVFVNDNQITIDLSDTFFNTLQTTTTDREYEISVRCGGNGGFRIPLNGKKIVRGFRWFGNDAVIQHRTGYIALQLRGHILDEETGDTNSFNHDWMMRYRQPSAFSLFRYRTEQESIYGDSLVVYDIKGTVRRNFTSENDNRTETRVSIDRLTIDLED